MITTVGMEALPLFRYKTGDFARILPGICPCGSEVLRIEVEDRIQKSPGIGHYDDLIFPYDSVIDFSINGNTVTILVKDEINSIKTPLRKLLRGFDVRFQTASLSDKPMYAGKRRIL